MSKTDRLFEVIQILRSAKNPVTSQQLSEMLEVSTRTIYRDIATLQSMRTPISGEAGIGYIIRPSYDLPPINFDVEEAEAISLGLSMITRTGDSGLLEAAKRAARKLSETAPKSDFLIASNWGAYACENLDSSLVRDAIRTDQKLKINYIDSKGDTSERTILPLALIYYADNIMLAAWCEYRKDFRHFRLARMQNCTVTDQRFTEQSVELRQEWEAVLKDKTVTTG